MCVLYEKEERRWGEGNVRERLIASRILLGRERERGGKKNKRELEKRKCEID